VAHAVRMQWRTQGRPRYARDAGCSTMHQEDTVDRRGQAPAAVIPLVAAVVYSSESKWGYSFSNLSIFGLSQ
jgi:hypothetical protein